FERPDAAVVLRHAEYLELLARQAQRADDAGKSPDAVITRASYRATIEQDVARIHAELTVNVIGHPWGEVPLKFGDAAVGDVHGDQGDVLLRGTGDGTYALLFKAQGEQRVRLELTTRVMTSPEGRQIDLDCPPSAITQFEIVIPQPDQDVEIRPRLLQQSSTSAENTTHVTANLGATGHIAAAWRPRATVKPEMQLLASVTNRQRHHFGDGLIHTDAWLTYDVLRGELSQLQIVVPPGHRILDVTATTKVQGWQTDEHGDRQVVTVDLLHPVRDQVTVELHTERKLGEQSVVVGGQRGDGGGAVAGIHALGIVRESGQIAVSHGSELSLRVTEQSGLVRIVPDEVAKEIRQPEALAYKFYSPEFTLAVAVSDVTPRISAVQQARVVIGDDELEVVSDLSYTIDRVGVFDLRIALPEGLIIDDVRSPRLQEFRVVDDTLLVVLQERTRGAVSVTVEGHQPLDEDAAAFTLPFPEPLGLERETGVVQLFADDSVEVTTNEAALEGARPAPAPPQDRGRSRLRAAWQYSRRPVTIPVAIARKPARLAASVATDVRVDATRTRVTTLVDFDVEYAGLDRFQVSIPEVARETLQVEAVATNSTSPSLKQQTAGDA
ncbi:MAG: hypothetical protein KF861_24045, partial [Planctomycetaceae bacterium]|nr:hypothetical protein [Planctomycetaceae bacterium]